MLRSRWLLRRSFIFPETFPSFARSASIQVVDPHIHLWDLKTHYYPWLVNPQTSFVGDARDLQHYLLADLRRDAEDIEVLKVMHVDANHDPADPGRGNALAARHLEAHAAFANTHGIRQILNVHDNRLYDYVGRHYMREPQWRKHFALLERFGMSFDLQLYPSQMEEAAHLAREHADTQFVINHGGMFVDRNSTQGYRAWRDGMRLRPYVHEIIDAFGCERAMFVSNFPVDRLFGSYADLWNAYAQIVGDASDSEKRALFVRNAERIYRI